MPKDYTLDDYSRPNLPCWNPQYGWNGEMPRYLKDAGVGPGMEVSDEVWNQACETSSRGNGTMSSDAFFFGLKRKGDASGTA